MRLSFTTIVKDELPNLKELMPLLVKYVDEIVIVDTGSTDGTVKYLERGGAKVLHTALDCDYSAARNMGLEACTGNWVFSLDADERPSTGLLDWLKQNLARQASSLVFRRLSSVDGEATADEYMIRAFHRNTGKWVGKIHEYIQAVGKQKRCPEDWYIAHDKTSERQHMRNKEYLRYYPKLNLGSGGRPMPVEEGWVNLDIDPDHAPDSVYADVFEELPGGLPAAYILAGHVLEHVGYHDASDVLAMWIRRLAPGGTIEVRVPDAGAAMRAYVSGDIHYLALLGGLYGGQTTSWDYHKMAIDEPWLTGQLTWYGLENLHRLPGREDMQELVMTARKPL